MSGQDAVDPHTVIRARAVVRMGSTTIASAENNV